MPAEETTNTIRIRGEDPGKFTPGSSRTISIDKTKGIQAIIGRLKGETKTSTQTFIFDKEKGWSIASASKWVKDKGSTIKAFDLNDSIETKAMEWFSENDYDVKECSIVREIHQFQVKANDDEDKRDGIKISGHLSTFKNIDRHNDIVMEGAFDKTIKEIKRAGKLPMLRDHSPFIKDQIGSWVKFKIDETGLFVEGFISRTSETEHIIKLIEDGHLDTLSMGGIFIFKDGGQPDKKSRRFIEEVVLFEGSVVAIPANPKATFSQKSLYSYDEKSEPVEDPNAPKVLVREKVLETVKLIKK